MAWKLRDGERLLQVQTSGRMIYLLGKAARETGFSGIAAYVRDTLSHAIAHDLDMDVEEIMAGLPPTYPRNPDGTYSRNTLRRK